MTALNYFNYFTEVEEYFWRKRGAHLLVSPLDWAIVETWQKSQIPIEAVLRGIDRAFESYARSRRGAGGRPLKSLAYCVDAVLATAGEMQESIAGAGPRTSSRDSERQPFSRDELRAFLNDRREKLLALAEKQGFSPNPAAQPVRSVAQGIARMEGLLDSPANLDLEDFERRLTILEEKLFAALHSAADEEALLRMRREMDRALAPYRRKMSAEQLTLVERQYIRKGVFEVFGMPRLSLYYLK